MGGLSYAEAVWARLDDVPDRTCLLLPDGTTISFGETAERARRIAAGLHAAGVRPGDRVVLFSTDRPEHVFVVLACLRLGATYVPLNYRLAATEVAGLVVRCAPRLVVTEQRYRTVVERATAPLPDVPVVYLDGEAGDADGLAALVRRGRDPEEQAVLAADDVVAIGFTSGTTGVPKGVLLTDRGMRAELANQGMLFPDGPEVRYTAAPLFHSSGHRLLAAHLAAGCTSLLLPQFDPAPIAEALRAGTLRRCLLVPTMLAMLLEHLAATREGDPRPVTGLAAVHYGGSPMSVPLLRRAIDELGCDVQNLFGSTESGLLTTLWPADHRRALAGHDHLLESVGSAISGVRIDLRAPDGGVVEAGRVGEITVRSDAAMDAYLDMPAETAGAVRHGRLWTGDLARRDEEGYFFLAGRSRDLIVRGGENVYPAEIENVLTRMPGIGAVAVVGRPDEHWGEVVVACVERGPATPSAEAMTAWCRERLAAFKVPVEFRVERSLPRTASGKIRKGELRDHRTA
jgi:acyl-CoA synthetase (AMP-forming)/AMP-acid ligase II